MSRKLSKKEKLINDCEFPPRSPPPNQEVKKANMRYCPLSAPYARDDKQAREVTSFPSLSWSTLLIDPGSLLSQNPLQPGVPCSPYSSVRVDSGMQPIYHPAHHDCTPHILCTPLPLPARSSHSLPSSLLLFLQGPTEVPSSSKSLPTTVSSPSHRPL